MMKELKKTMGKLTEETSKMMSQQVKNIIWDVEIIKRTPEKFWT